jgi:hypothetical protein
MALHPDAEFAVTRLKAAAASAHGRVNALEARLNRFEASGTAPPTVMYGDEEFWTEVTARFRGFVETHVSKLEARIKAQADRITQLEARGVTEYVGIWKNSATMCAATL